MNKLFITGNLCAAPELKYTSSGKAVSEFSLAVNEGTKDKPKSYFFSVQVWDKAAEYFCERATKGDAVMIQGRLIQESWDKNGEKQSRTRIVSEEIKFLTFKKGGETAPAARTETRQSDTDESPF